MKTLEELKDLKYRSGESEKSARFLAKEMGRMIELLDDMEASDWYPEKDADIEKVLSNSLLLLKHSEIERLELGKVLEEIKNL